VRSKLTYFLETMLKILQGPMFDQDSGIYIAVFGFLDRGSVFFFSLLFGNNNNIGSVLS